MRARGGWVWAGVITLALSGCPSPEPPSVYVNIDTLSRSLPQPQDGLSEVNASGLAVKGSVALGTASRPLGVGDLEASIKKSQAEVRANQELALQRILAQRLQVLDAEVESALQAARNQLRPEHDRIMDEALAKTREPFDRMAPEVGRLTLELTNLIGFPDAGQPFVAQDADWSRKRAERVEEIRQRLRQLEERYLSERAAILTDASNRIQADMDRLKLNADVARLEGLTRLRESLRQLSISAAEQRPFSAPESWDLPSVPSKTTDISAPSETARLDTRPPAAREPRWIAAEQARIWAAHRGYRLVGSPNEGRDATQECQEWIRQQLRGP